MRRDIPDPEHVSVLAGILFPHVAASTPGDRPRKAVEVAIELIKLSNKAVEAEEKKHEDSVTNR